MATSDLYEFAIAALQAGSVDEYGVGTQLTTGSTSPTADLIYKLVARENSVSTLTGRYKERSIKTKGYR